MIGWRLAKGRYADPPASAFDGEGSRRRGGRWSPPGTRVAYASTSLALAALEYFVNLDSGDAPDGLVSIGLEIPDDVKVERIDIATLPSWSNLLISPAHPDFQRFAFSRPQEFQFDARMWK